MGENNHEYEDVCSMCMRPESKAGRMIHIPNMNGMCICIDCMERRLKMMEGTGINYHDMIQGMNLKDLFPGGPPPKLQIYYVKYITMI